jgi:hypothetical protein
MAGPNSLFGGPTGEQGAGREAVRRLVWQPAMYPWLSPERCGGSGKRLNLDQMSKLALSGFAVCEKKPRVIPRHSGLAKSKSKFANCWDGGQVGKGRPGVETRSLLLSMLSLRCH